jgi:hypothetical protein
VGAVSLFVRLLLVVIGVGVVVVLIAQGVHNVAAAFALAWVAWCAVLWREGRDATVGHWWSSEGRRSAAEQRREQTMGSLERSLTAVAVVGFAAFFIIHEAYSYAISFVLIVVFLLLVRVLRKPADPQSGAVRRGEG